MVTLKDIAKEAGVSVMTVSNIVNGNYTKVSKETAEHVQKIISQMGMFLTPLQEALQKAKPTSSQLLCVARKTKIQC